MATDTGTREIAPGVVQVTVGAPVESHVYLIDSPDGVVAFDAGVSGAGPEILAAAGGSIAKVVLSHSHADHRGAANELDAPIHCHPDEVADAEGPWPQQYLDFGLISNPAVREGLPLLNQRWDGGPVKIAGTLEEGDEVAGMRVLHAPGHAPGLIVLFRESDRLLLAGDAIYTIDLETGEPTPARVPHPAANWDTEKARESIRRLAALEPSSVWPGHSDPVTEDVVAQLETAARESADRLGKPSA